MTTTRTNMYALFTKQETLSVPRRRKLHNPFVLRFSLYTLKLILYLAAIMLYQEFHEEMTRINVD